MTNAQNQTATALLLLGFSDWHQTAALVAGDWVSSKATAAGTETAIVRPSGSWLHLAPMASGDVGADAPFSLEWFPPMDAPPDVYRGRNTLL